MAPAQQSNRAFGLDGRLAKPFGLQKAVDRINYVRGGFDYFGIKKGEQVYKCNINDGQPAMSVPRPSVWDAREQRNFYGEIFFVKSQLGILGGNLSRVLLLSKDLWSQILTHISSHPLFVEFQYRYEWNGAFTTRTTYEEDSLTPKAYHIIVKVPSKGQLDAAFYLRFEVVTKKWHLVLTGNEIEAHKQDVESFFSSAYDQESDPFAVLVLLVWRYSRRIEEEYSSMEMQASANESLTGLGSQGQNAMPKRIPDHDDIRRIHGIAGNLRAAAFGIGFQIELISFLQDCHKKVISLTQMHPFLEKEQEIQEEMNTIKQIMLRQRTHYQEEGFPRTQAQIDGMNMLIDRSNADSNLSLAINSNEMAASTARETTAMMTIALLGLLYLPTTFTSTLFSSVFFSRDPSTNNLMAAKDVWILVLSALLFTLFTLALWVWLNKHQGLSQLSKFSKQLTACWKG